MWLVAGKFLYQQFVPAVGPYSRSTYGLNRLAWIGRRNFLRSSVRNWYLGWFYSLTMNGPNQFVYSIFEPASFLPLRASTFSPTSNFFAHFSGAEGMIHDDLSDFAIATSNSLAKLVLNAMTSIWGVSIAHIARILNSISKGDLPSVPGLLRYPPSIAPRQSSQLRSLLLPQLSVLFASKFLPSSLLSHFIMDVSWNYLPLNWWAGSIISDCCTVELRVAIAQDSHRVPIQLTYLFLNELDHPATTEIIWTNGTGYWPTGQVLNSQKNIFVARCCLFQRSCKVNRQSMKQSANCHLPIRCILFRWISLLTWVTASCKVGDIYPNIRPPKSVRNNLVCHC